MEDKIRKSIRQFTIQLGLIFFAAFIVTLFLITSVTDLHMKKMAHALSATVHDALLIRDYRSATSNLEKSDDFEKIVFIRNDGKTVFSLPTEYENPTHFWEGTAIVPIYFGTETKLEGTLTFTYSKGNFLPYTVLAWLVLLIASLPLILRARKNIVRQIELEMDSERANALFQVTEQVAHDIRSPVAALHAAFKIGNSTAVETSLKKIKAISNDLLLHKMGASHERVSRLHSIQRFLGDLVSEKRLEYGEKFQINLAKENDAWVLIEETGFLRALGNLINNAAEATDRLGVLNISVEKRADGLSVILHDNGPGISPSIAANLGKRGVTFGKKQGSGLGLYSSIETIKSNGGDLKIASTGLEGTKIEIYFPFPRIFLIDDDETIRALWEKAAKKAGLNFAAVKNLEEFLALSVPIQNTVIYVDSSLGDKAPGEIQAKRLFDHGYKNLSLATAHLSDKFSRAEVPWISDVIGKEPPWLV